MSMFSSSQRVVIQETASCLQHLVEHSITARSLAQTEAAINSKVSRKQRATTPLETFVTTLEGGLSPRYQSAWDEILLIIAALFEVYFHSSLSPYFPTPLGSNPPFLRSLPPPPPPTETWPPQRSPLGGLSQDP